MVGVLGGFLDSTLPAAVDRGIAVVGMRVPGASRRLDPGAEDRRRAATRARLVSGDRSRRRRRLSIFEMGKIVK